MHNIIIYIIYVTYEIYIVFIILYYSTYHCVTIAYSIQYSNILYRFVT